MKWTRNRFLPVSYVVVLAALVIVGCTSKQEPAEHLAVCGNASCGDLVMVTTDTSSDGFHYLNPSLSPDGSQILFTADWWAIPSDPRASDDAVFVARRQLITIPVQVGVQPDDDLLAQGATLVKVQETDIRVAGEFTHLGTEASVDGDKGDPIWQDDQHVICYMQVNRIGCRLFQIYLDDPAEAPGFSSLHPLYMEPTDADVAPRFWQHQSPNLSSDGRWLLFTRSGCLIADSLETCTNVSIWALDMSTAGANDGYDVTAFPVTNEYSRVERPHFSPDGTQIVFSGGFDVAGRSDSGTELFTVDFDTTGLAAGTMALDNNLRRITFTSYAEGDPLVGVLNSDPCWSPDGRTIYFVSTRRAPTTTLHDRNIWRVPADGTRDPEIYFFSREDDLDPFIAPDGTMYFSSMVGFPTGMLNRLQDEAYQRIKEENIQEHLADPDEVALLTEIQLQTQAAAARRQLEFFAGVMAHLYTFRGN